MKCDQALSDFAEKVFSAYQAMDLMKMTLVDPHLLYRSAFALKLCRDIAEIGGDRRTDPTAATFSHALVIHRCTTELKELMTETDGLVQEAMIRVCPQTTWWHRRMSGALARSKHDEVTDFMASIDNRSAAIAKASNG